MLSIIPIILSGGSGRRLWPLSRRQLPKQFLKLSGQHTMLQDTITRLSGISNLKDPIIVCNEEHRFLVAEQCKQINVSNPTILLEPIGKNTAPAIAAAAVHSIKDSPGAVLLVLSADHIIKDVNKFYRAIDIAFKQAKEDKLVVFGVMPTDANTNYGYIKSSKNNKNGAYKVEEFLEKPALEIAKLYFEQGNYLWNSGMFMFNNNILISELTIHSQPMLNAVTSAVNLAIKDLDFIRLDKNSFESCPSDSIDYAIMEKTNNLVVVPLEAQWNDIGTWSTLYDIGIKDDNGNVINGDVFANETHNTYIKSTNHIVATIGVKDLVIIDTENATLISTKEKAHEVKKIVEYLEKENRDEHLFHRKVYRPWGWYDSIEAGKHFQVKRLHVNPGGKLSLQLHNNRAEHWVVVSGEATVINGQELLILIEGESTYIPIGTKHSLENKTHQLLEIIEVQSGSYLGEDDIIRFDDIYGRMI